MNEIDEKGVVKSGLKCVSTIADAEFKEIKLWELKEDESLYKWSWIRNEFGKVN